MSANQFGPLIHVAALLYEGELDVVITAVTPEALEQALDAYFAQCASEDEEGIVDSAEYRSSWDIDRMQTPLHGVAL